jgi:MFS family permease
MGREPGGVSTGPGGLRRLRRGLHGMALDITPLRGSRDFRFLFFGQGINLIGSQVRIVTLPYQVFLITHSSLAVGLLSLVQFFPLLVTSFIGGALADAMDRRRLLLVTQALLAITSGLLALGSFIGRPSLGYLLGVAAVASAISAIDAPTRRAVIPRLVGREQIAQAISLNQALNQLGNALGPAVAGLILAGIGIGSAYLFDAITFLISILTLLCMAPMPPLLDTRQAQRRGLSAIREGLGFLRDKPVLLSTFIIDIDATFFGVPRALFPALATQVFKAGPTGLGLLYAAPGAGALVGALLTGWVSRMRRQGRAVIIAVCVWGAAIAGFGLMTHYFPLALLCLAVAGAADMYSAVFRGTILQSSVPDRLQGRLSAVHFMVVNSGPRLGDFEASVVAALSSLEFSVVSGGVAAFVGAIAIALAIPSFGRYDATTVPQFD